MRKAAKILLVTVLALSFVLLTACGGNSGGEDPAKSDPVDKVNSIWITYNGTPVYGVLSVDMSKETVILDAQVAVTGNPAYTVAFSSNNTSVASIAGKTVSLHRDGEAVITASAGGTKHEIVLVVGDDSADVPETYSIDVVDGTPSVSKAAEGDFVTVTAADLGNGWRFKEWQWDANIEWRNGNMFRMPACAVTITAVFDQLDLYTVTVTNGSASVASAPEGDYVTLAADAAPEHYRFKEWSFDVDGIPVSGNMFRMPAENVTVTAIYEQYEFLITVFGGTANAVYAEKGATITLTPDADTVSHYFTGWSFDVTGVSAEGNTFTMPGSDVIVTAVFNEKDVILGISFNKNELLLLIDEQENLIVNVEAYGNVNDDYEWLVSEKDLDGNTLPAGSVIEYTDDGEITAVGIGKAVLTVTITDTDFPFYDECEITVANLKLFGGTVAGVDYVGTAYDEYSESNGYMYSIAAGENLTLVADEAPEGKMFVGWDIGSEGYRLGDPGAAEYTFEMTNDPYTIWSVFSEYSNLFNSGSTGLDQSDVGSMNAVLGLAKPASNFGRTTAAATTAVTISNGTPSDRANDPDLEGMNGVGLGIASNTVAGNYNRLRGSNLNNVTVKGAVTITVIFKNNSQNYDLTVELMAESYDAVATTGSVTVPKNSAVKKTFVVQHGFMTPYFIFIVKNSVGGNGSERIQFDIVARQAATYMKFDPSLPTENVANFANFPTDNQNRVSTDNGHGLLLYDGNFNNGNRYGTLTNLPAGETTTTVYFKVVNYNIRSVPFTFKFGTTGNGSELATDKVFTMPGMTAYDSDVSVTLFSMEIDRSANPSAVYFSFTWTGNDRKCFSIQMSYSNVYGM